jgi:hypothetical protein
MTNSFSRRNGFRVIQEVDISIREDAPDRLREFIVELTFNCGLSAKQIRQIFCSYFRKSPNQDYWSSELVLEEVHSLIANCRWYEVYDLIEKIIEYITEKEILDFDVNEFSDEINDFFIENGIGWILIDGLIEVRGPKHFQQFIKKSIESLSTAGLNTAHSELQEALHDLSRRPNPDITGAIHHAMGALESTVRNVCDNEKMTLGELIKKNKNIFPCPLGEVVLKSWGYASESGRHIKEGGTASYEEAMLILGLASTLCIFLSAKKIILTNVTTSLLAEL